MLGLYSDYVAKACPFSQEELDNKLEGEFLRARLKPDEGKELFLYVRVNCIELTNMNKTHTGYAMSTNVMFGLGEESPEMLIRDDYGTMAAAGTDEASKRFLLNTVTEKVSDAITDYLKHAF
ncbi:peptidyl-prolyl cis-trans isomerase [Vibrio astriarenae]|nr:peptidyl-prolyl cis-trans isomerase [Vibrio sp. C7]